MKRVSKEMFQVHIFDWMNEGKNFQEQLAKGERLFVCDSKKGTQINNYKLSEFWKAKYKPPIRRVKKKHRRRRQMRIRVPYHHTLDHGAFGDRGAGYANKQHAAQPGSREKGAKLKFGSGS